MCLVQVVVILWVICWVFCFVLFWTGCFVALADLEFRFLLPLASNTGITGTSFMVMYLRHGLHFSYGYKLASLLSK